MSIVPLSELARLTLDANLKYEASRKAYKALRRAKSGKGETFPMSNGLRILCERQDWICGLCELSMNDETASRDHIVPRSLLKHASKLSRKELNNGRTLKNLRAVHKLCNNIRGNDITEHPPKWYRDRTA